MIYGAYEDLLRGTGSYKVMKCLQLLQIQSMMDLQGRA